MTDTQMEITAWWFGLVLFGLAAAFPHQLIRFLGRGHGHPRPGLLIFLRITAVLCFVGTIYRLFSLYQR
jgi:hypothetical protein